MLTNSTSDLSWSGLDRVVQPVQARTEVLSLLSALDEGWEIVETIHLTPFSQSDVNAYVLTLFHPKRLMTNMITLTSCEEAQDLLRFEAVTVVNRHCDRTQ